MARTGRYIAQAEIVLIIGPPRVVKTHLAIALGRLVIETNHSVLFISAMSLLAALAKAFGEEQWKYKLDDFTKPELLVGDELGYLPSVRCSAHLFFQLVAPRYEKCSMLITTNQLVSHWDSIFVDVVLAAVILDRLLHHSHPLVIQGESYRL